MVTRRFIAAAAAASLAACAGHSTIPATPAHVPQGNARVAFTIHIPKAAAAQARKPKYVSAGTKSVSVDAFNGAGDVLSAFDVAPGSPNCSSDSTGTSCTETIDAPIGNGGLTIEAYDGVLDSKGVPQGNVLSRGTTYDTITEGVANTVKVTLFGTPAKATLTIANPSPPQGSSTTTAVTLVAKDADGYAIVGSYSDFIEFPCNPTATQYSLSTTVNGQSSNWISASTDTIALTYVGYGIESATLQACLVSNESDVLASAALTPQAVLGAEMPVDTSLDGSSAFVDALSTITFTEPAKSRFATLAKGATQPLYYPVASGAQPSRLSGTNPLYMTLSDNALGEYSNNQIIEHALPTPNAGLYGLGGQWWYDFSVWFTEHDAGKIGEMQTISTTYGHITEYSTGNPNSTPAGMAYGGGGFFFADPGANAIGFVNPGTAGAPVITEYSLPTAAAQPLEITNADTNQRCWFTEKAVSKVGRIDASGNIQEFASGDVPVAIQYADGAVFVLTASHTIEQYDIQTGTYTTITPPASTNGPVVGLAYGGFHTLLVMRGNGSTGALQNYYF